MTENCRSIHLQINIFFESICRRQTKFESNECCHLGRNKKLHGKSWEDASYKDLLFPLYVLIKWLSQFLESLGLFPNPTMFCSPEGKLY